MLVNTRLNNNENKSTATFCEAIMNPISAHGGLWAFESLPKVEFDKLSSNYKELSLQIIKSFNFNLELSEFEKALFCYENFDNKQAVKIKKINDIYINELWHGPTRAFKDMALQPFGIIINSLAKKNNEKFLIIVATSGDTGPATLESFKNSQNVKVICMYPNGGTSEVQRLQMLSYDCENLKVLGINGNFDDAQRTLKTLLANDEFKAFLQENGLKLSAANSVNFGRILFQIIYHFYALIKSTANANNPKNIIIPSGNFGNALGAYYAKKMGAPIKKIGIASNANNVLTNLIENGIYDLRDKKLIPTISPAMDILISSNVERLLFDLFGAIRTKELLDSLAINKFYKLSKDELAKIQEIFWANYCDDNECKSVIKYYANLGELIDPHTATAIKMASSGDIVASTAQWVKFAPSMWEAIKNEKCQNEIKALHELSKEYNSILPNSIQNLFKYEIKQGKICDQDEIYPAIKEWLK